MLNLKWNERKKAVIRVRAKILDAARTWFKEHNFTEVQGPILIPAIGDWPNYFEVKYYDKKAYLTQGLGPYAQILMANLGKIYTIAPAFRKEKRITNRHLTEYWQIEAEIPNGDLNDIIKTQEQLITHICQTIYREAQEELKNLPRNPKELKRIRPPFPKITYDEAIEILQKHGYNIQWGMTLEWEHEKYLSLQTQKPLFITEYPINPETYFYKTHPIKPATTLTTDLLAPEGYGELSTGGQPTTQKKELLKKMKQENITTQEQKWYIKLAESQITYAGFGIGLERIIQWICKLKEIKETIIFPRTLTELSVIL